MIQIPYNSKLQINNTTGYKGVYWNTAKRRFKAQIRFNGKRIGLGSYRTAIEASEAYIDKAKELFGEFAYVGK